MNRTLNTLLTLSILFLFFQGPISLAQDLTQTIRGKVIDQDSRTPLPGVNVVILDNGSFKGTSTDADGEFRLEDIPVGRVSLKISYVGYEEKVLPNILLTSGKEAVLEVEMRESLISMDEIVVTADKDKSQIANEMALVSARGFTVEETKRYAGSFNDPARMVAGYAGVSQDATGDNSIVVRGNSPKGIQWRLEGIEIPNPNHFSDEGATGGPINALNSKVLDNSEFYSGAFAPQYGNALSGIFDMRMRKGNDEQREYSLTLGVLGTEANIEGPFKKGGGSSYLLNYRYSTLTLLNDMGLVDFDGIPKYQDLSFKVHLPLKSLGTVSIFGLGGKSSIIEKIYDEEDEDKLLEEGDYHADMGVVGLTHYWPIGKNTYFENSFSVSKNGSGYLGYEPNDQNEFTLVDDGQLDKSTIRGASTINYKHNARHNFQAGVVYTHHYFDFYNSYYDTESDDFITNQNIDGDAVQYQGFVSWKFRPLENLSFVTGLHANGTSLNDKVSVESRSSVRWEFTDRQALTAGIGTHSKMESLTNYYSIIPDNNGNVSMPNQDLGFSKAQHYVLGYENLLGPNLFFKLEAYYQHLYNIPIENKEGSSYSLINQVEWFTDRELVNEGTGENIGVEMTLERYFADDYYFMATASLYDSKYTAMDGISRDTRFNGNYNSNFLFGKEFQLNSKENKKKVIGLNAKISLLGAQRYTPLNEEESIARDEAVYYEDRAFSLRGEDVFIANLGISYRIDRKKTSQELKLDIQNVTNNSATVGYYYNAAQNQVERFDQLPLLPVLMYTIHF